MYAFLPFQTPNISRGLNQCGVVYFFWVQSMLPFPALPNQTLDPQSGEKSTKSNPVLLDARLLIKRLSLDPNPALMPVLQKEILLSVTLLSSAPVIQSPTIPHFLIVLLLILQWALNRFKRIPFPALSTMTLLATTASCSESTLIPSAFDLVLA